jgi:hypothetical protein
MDLRQNAVRLIDACTASGALTEPVSPTIIADYTARMMNANKLTDDERNNLSREIEETLSPIERRFLMAFVATEIIMPALDELIAYFLRTMPPASFELPPVGALPGETTTN